MPKVTVVSEKRDIEIPAGSNLRVEARKAAVDLYKPLERYANCRGLGMCGTCKVLVKKGMENLGPRTAMERLTIMRSMTLIGQEDEIRLACQCTVNGDCTIEIKPDDNLYGENFWQKPYPNK